MRLRSLLLLVLLAPLAAAQTMLPHAVPGPPPLQPAAGDDFVVAFQGRFPEIAATGANATVVRFVPGELLEVRFNSTKERLVGAARFDGAFAVAWPKQVVPESEDHFFAEVFDPNVGEAASWARVVNLSGASRGDFAQRLAFPVNATTNSTWLRFTRDVTPPSFTLGAVQNLTHQSFYLETTTSEYSYADLVVRRIPGGEAVRNPTTIPALLQRFPVQGLRPESDHVFWVNFTDWAGNLNKSQDMPLRTLPRPILPAATITAVEPRPNATLGEPVRMVAVNFTGPAPPSVDYVNVFVDKVPTREGLVLVEGRLAVTLAQPLGKGRHTIGVELRTAQGGEASTQWAFEVQPDRGTAGPGAALLLAALLGLALARRARR